MIHAGFGHRILTSHVNHHVGFCSCRPYHRPGFLDTQRLFEKQGGIPWRFKGNRHCIDHFVFMANLIANVVRFQLLVKYRSLAEDMSFRCKRVDGAVKLNDKRVGYKVDLRCCVGASSVKDEHTGYHTAQDAVMPHWLL